MTKPITPESAALTVRIIDMRDTLHMSWRAIAEEAELSPAAVQERYKHARGIDSVVALRAENRRLRNALRKVKEALEDV